MKPKITAFLWLELGLLALTGPVSAATTIYDNIGDLNVGLANSFSGVTFYASFSTGSSSLGLSDVVLSLSGNSAATPGNGTVTLSLYADSSLTPGDSIASLGSTTVSNANNTLVDFDLSNTVLLSANTRYWIGASSSSTNLSWDWVTDTNGTGVANEYSYALGSLYDNATYGPYVMQVSAVPLPPTLVLMASGVLGLALAGRWKKA